MGEDPRSDKSALRRALLQARRAVSPAERTRLAARVCTQLIRFAPFVRARDVGAYAAIDAELDPHPAVAFARSLGAVTYFPGGTPGDLRLVASAPERLTPGAHGYPEPGEGAELGPTVAAAVVLVPGVAFTPDGRRLGRGGGDYDRLLTRYPEALRIGLASETQLLPSLPEEPWDQRVHAVVTEARLLAVAGPLAHFFEETHA